jgi:hypothetical protein
MPHLPGEAASRPADIVWKGSFWVSLNKWCAVAGGVKLPPPWSSAKAGLLVPIGGWLPFTFRADKEGALARKSARQRMGQEDARIVSYQLCIKPIVT